MSKDLSLFRAAIKLLGYIHESYDVIELKHFNETTPNLKDSSKKQFKLYKHSMSYMSGGLLYKVVFHSNGINIVSDLHFFNNDRETIKSLTEFYKLYQNELRDLKIDLITDVLS